MSGNFIIQLSSDEISDKYMYVCKIVQSYWTKVNF